MLKHIFLPNNIKELIQDMINLGLRSINYLNYVYLAAIDLIAKD